MNLSPLDISQSLGLDVTLYDPDCFSYDVFQIRSIVFTNSKVNPEQIFDTRGLSLLLFFIECVPLFFSDRVVPGDEDSF